MRLTANSLQGDGWRPGWVLEIVHENEEETKHRHRQDDVDKKSPNNRQGQAEHIEYEAEAD